MEEAVNAVLGKKELYADRADFGVPDPDGAGSARVAATAGPSIIGYSPGDTGSEESDKRVYSMKTLGEEGAEEIIEKEKKEKKEKKQKDEKAIHDLIDRNIPPEFDRNKVSIIVNEFERVQGDLLINKAVMVYEYNGVLVVKNIGQKDEVKEGDVRRAVLGLTASSEKLSPNQVIVVLGNKIRNDQIEDVVKEANEHRDPTRIIAFGVNGISVVNDKTRLSGVKILGDSNSFKADRYIADEAKVKDEYLTDAELNQKLTRSVATKGVHAFTTSYIDENRKTHKRKGITNEEDGLTLIQDVGEGEFSKGFIRSVYSISGHKSGGGGMDQMNMEALMNPGAGKSPGIKGDSIFGEVKDIKDEDISIEAEGTGAVLKIGHSKKFTADYIDETIEEQYEPQRSPETPREGLMERFLHFLGLRSLFIDLQLWIRLAPNPFRRKVLVGATVAGIVFISFPLALSIGSLLGWLGVLSGTFLTAVLGVKAEKWISNVKISDRAKERWRLGGYTTLFGAALVSLFFLISGIGLAAPIVGAIVFLFKSLATLGFGVVGLTLARWLSN